MKKGKLLSVMQRVRKWTLSALKYLVKKLNQLKELKEKVQNLKRIDVITSCDDLKAWKFFKILKEKEYRYLLDTKKLVPYFSKRLVPVWDNILTEFDEKNKTYIFSNAFKDAYSDLIEENELIIMRACLGLMTLGQKEAFKELELVGVLIPHNFSLDNIRKLKSIIAQRETRIQIQSLSQKEEKKDTDYIKSITDMSNILGRNIDKDKITVTEWIYLNNDCREIIKARKEHGQSH